MKTLINVKQLRLLSIVSLAAFTLVGCGSGGTNWGIDHGSEVEISHGPVQADGNFRCTLEDAALVKPGGIVKPLVEGTQIRVWHFQNSEEYVCTLKGQATVKQPEVGA